MHQKKNKKMAINLALVGIGFLVIFIILTVLYWTQSKEGAQRLQGYLSMISFLSLVTAIISFFITQQNSIRQQQQTNVTQGLGFIQSDLLSLYRYIEQNPTLYKMWKGIKPENAQLAHLPDIPVDPTQVAYKEIYVTQLMFQIIEDFVNFVKSHGYSFSSENNQLWVAEFKNWFNYPIVREQWQYAKLTSGKDMIDFVEKYLMV